jgi:hypothetical protein
MKKRIERIEKPWIGNASLIKERLLKENNFRVSP